jgi:hypothetical protein
MEKGITRWREMWVFGQGHFESRALRQGLDP